MDSSAPQASSMASQLLNGVGLFGLALLLLSGLAALAIVCLMAWRGRGPMAVCTVLLAAHTPLLFSVLLALSGIWNSYRIIATSGTTPRPSELAFGISTALLAPRLALLLTLPIYAVAILGCMVRALTAPRKESH